MSSDPLAGFGATVTIGGTAIGQVRGIDGPGQELDDIETSHGNLADPIRTFIPGMINSGEVSLEMVYSGAGYDVASSKFYARAVETVVITYANGDTHSFSGYVKAIGPASEYQAEITSSMTIKATGAVTFTEAA